MMKLLLGATLTVAALASTQLLADPDSHRHRQNTPRTDANCPAATATTEQHGQHSMGHGGMHGRMQPMHGEHRGMAAQGKPGAQRSNAGCPMHTERKPT